MLDVVVAAVLYFEIVDVALAVLGHWVDWFVERLGIVVVVVVVEAEHACFAVGWLVVGIQHAVWLDCHVINEVGWPYSQRPAVGVASSENVVVQDVALLPYEAH